MGRNLTDGEREVIREQEADARAFEESGVWHECEACGGHGVRIWTDDDAVTCQECLGLGAWREFDGGGPP